jgi:hypothetical protein
VSDARGPDPARAALDARVLAWLGEPGVLDAPRDEERFSSLALELFAFQFGHCEPYRRFCQGRGRTPGNVTSWREIPPVPTGAFKEVELRSFPAERCRHAFRTSGTATERRGTLWLDTLALYEASLLPTFCAHVLPDLGARPVLLRVLAPSARETPDSSLSHMFETVLRRLDLPGGGFDVRDGRLDVDGLLARLEGAQESGLAVALCGTSFSFVHLLDALAARGGRIALPEGSRVMETGGFKGRSRELGRGELYAALAVALGVEGGRIVNQYGMTELASQFYDSVLRQPGEPRRKLAPPWTRVRVVDPESGEDVPPGQTGALVIVDLANTGSVLALQTADLGRALGDGFEVVGREPGAEARGCSIAADAMLGAAGP